MRKETILGVIMLLALIGISYALPAGPGSPTLPSDTYLDLKIISPIDNYNTSSGIVNFTFNASSNLGLIDKCELIVNTNIVKTVNNLSDSRVNKISFTLSNGENFWSIKCYAGGSFNESVLRKITIGTPCINSCNNNGEKTCSGNGFKSCGDFNKDGCLEWSIVTNCGDQICVRGSCVNNFPACVEGDWNYVLSPVICPSNGKQLKTWTLIGNCNEGVSHSNENVTCNYQTPGCTGFTYSSWSACSSSGVQTRTISSSSPSGCSGGNPVLSQQCVYVPTCTESDWSSSISPVSCPSTNSQTKTWTKIGNCSGGVQKTTETVNCVSQITCTNFTYSDYSECTLSNVQTREVLSKLPANCSGGNPIISSSCSFSDYLKRIIGFNSEVNSENISISKNNVSIVKFEKVNTDGLNLTNVLIKEGKEDGNYFLIVQNGLASDSKGIYFNLSSTSKGICVKDEEISDLSDIKKKCVYINCPGNSGEYVCARESDGRFSVSGLKHSGILEVSGDICSDGVCSNSEDCSSCPSDCGECTRINIPSSGSGRVYTNMGSQSSSGTNTNTGSRNPVTNVLRSNQNKSPVSPGNVDSVGESINKNNNVVWIFIGLIIGVILIVIILVIIIFIFRKKKVIQPVENNQGPV